MNSLLSLKYLVIIAAILFVISCSENTITPTAKIDYFPLKIGNTWTYASSLSDSTFHSETNTESDTETIVSIDTVEGKKCFGIDDGHEIVYQFKTDSALFVYSIFNPFAQISVWTELYNLHKELTIASFDTVVGPKENLISINFRTTSKPLSSKGTFKYKGVSYETRDFEMYMIEKRTFASNPQANQEISNTTKVSFVDGIGLVGSYNKRTSINKIKGEVSTYTKKVLTSTNLK